MADEHLLDEFAEPNNDETVIIPPVAGGGAAAGYGAPTFAATTDGAAAAMGPSRPDARRRNPRLPLIATLIVVGVLLVAAVAGFFTARWYFGDKAAPGVSLGGVSVTGQTHDELVDTVDGVVADTVVTVRDDEGNEITATLEDLGVSVDVDATVDDLLNAKGADELLGLTRVNPFASREVGLHAEFDDYTMETYLTDAFVSEDERAVASTIAYDPASQRYAVTEGRQGRSVTADEVASAVKHAIAHPGTASTATIAYADVDMPIGVDAANQAAAFANQRLDNPIVITNGNASEFQLPADAIASWTVVTNDLENGTIDVSYNEQAVADYLATAMPERLNQEMVTQEDVVNSSGAVVLTKVRGVDGVTVTSTDDAATQVFQALQAGQPATVQATVEVVEHDTTQTVVTMRIVVDKSSQTATVYNNDAAVRTFNVCTGTPGSFGETDGGTFYIYLKYSVQDMTGKNEDGSTYLSKGVKWVSYFNGGEGFHTASWNNYGIAHGDPANYGSHGCVNMYEADAQWIYDNCPEGTIVQVVGTTPSGPVR